MKGRSGSTFNLFGVPAGAGHDNATLVGFILCHRDLLGSLSCWRLQALFHPQQVSQVADYLLGTRFRARNTDLGSVDRLLLWRIGVSLHGLPSAPGRDAARVFLRFFRAGGRLLVGVGAARVFLGQTPYGTYQNDNKKQSHAH